MDTLLLSSLDRRVGRRDQPDRLGSPRNGNLVLRDDRFPMLPLGMILELILLRMWTT